MNANPIPVTIQLLEARILRLQTAVTALEAVNRDGKEADAIPTPVSVVTAPVTKAKIARKVAPPVQDFRRVAKGLTASMRLVAERFDGEFSLPALKAAILERHPEFKRKIEGAATSAANLVKQGEWTQTRKVGRVLYFKRATPTGPAATLAEIHRNLPLTERLADQDE
ncbi:hypothetical protein D4Q85_00200 [bacterium]|nr:MAG: hypothetical protein D4Q85_00200 [bacterium]